MQAKEKTMFEFDGKILTLQLSEENPQHKILIEQLHNKYQQANELPPTSDYKFNLTMTVTFSGCIAVDLFGGVTIINDYYKMYDIKLIEADQAVTRP